MVNLQSGAPRVGFLVFYFQASKNPLIQCLLCECSTLEESLSAHIQYNHMIYKDQILKVRNDEILKYPELLLFCVSGSV